MQDICMLSGEVFNTVIFCGGGYQTLVRVPLGVYELLLGGTQAALRGSEMKFSNYTFIEVVLSNFYHIFTLFLCAIIPKLNFIGLTVFIYELFYCFLYRFI